MSEYSVGSGAGSVSSQIRCSHVPYGNFTTRPSALEPWTAHASCSKHTKCTCAICSCWPETTWFGFDNWMLRRKQRSQRDAANGARKAKARARERSESPPTLSPARFERGRARTRRTGGHRYSGHRYSRHRCCLHRGRRYGGRRYGGHRYSGDRYGGHHDRCCGHHYCCGIVSWYYSYLCFSRVC